MANIHDHIATTPGPLATVCLHLCVPFNLGQD